MDVGGDHLVCFLQFLPSLTGDHPLFAVVLPEEQIEDNADEREADKDDYPRQTLHRITVFHNDHDDDADGSEHVKNVQCRVQPLSGGGKYV